MAVLYVFDNSLMTSPGLGSIHELNWNLIEIENLNW